MKLFNRWLREQMPPAAWPLYRAIERLPFGRPVVDPARPGQVLYPGLDAAGLAAARPPEVEEATWLYFMGMLCAGIKNGNTFPMESWLLAGLCSDGPRAYCPTPADWGTLGRSECNFTFGQYRQPYPATCVVVPEELGWDLGPDTGRPVFVLVRHVPGMIGLSAFCAGVPSPKNLSVFMTRGGEHELIEGRFDWTESPDFVPTLGADDWSKPLDRSEKAFFNEAKRAALNACMLLTSYGHTPAAPANPEYAARLRQTLAKKTAPAGAKAHAREELARMPLVVSLAQSVTLREHRTAAGAPGGPTGRRVKPHWRRGHWANVRAGVGRAETRRVFRAELFVNLHLMGGADPRPATVVYHAPRLPTRGQPVTGKSGNSP